jgi:adenylate cyclase
VTRRRGNVDSVYRGHLQSTPPLAHLVLEAPGENREISLDAVDVWKLGRSDKCEIVIQDEMISRTHAMIQRTDIGEYCFIDMGSRNGSFVNDRRVSIPVLLRSGDRISIGQTRIIFQDPSGVPRGSTPLQTGGITQVFFAQRLVSVLVVDIRDYTGLTRAIDQSVLCQVVGSWFGEADHIMRRYGSSAQKYIGDAVMALWLHQTHGQEQREILQSLSAVAEFAEATARLRQRFGLPAELLIGAGLNTGSAAVGNPGTRQVMDFTALGDSVNAAFRLETATKELGADILLGKNTFNYLRPLPASTQYFAAADINLKGYDVAAQTWSITFAQLGEFLKKVADDPNRTIEAPEKI